MECIFLNPAGTTLFVRDDMESGHWVQQQYSVNADFPFVPGKVIERGMRIAFRDPATDNIEVFEIRNVVNTEPDHFQQITAEHIALAELSDEHIDTTEITDKTAAQALSTALTGTLWSVGNNTASGTQSTDFSRGSVWNAVNAIQNNWNVYITPRVVISSAGAITGRYLDIAPAGGTFRGVRLSIQKNLLDPSVTYDDSEVLTALYGYGGNVDVTVAGEDDQQEELTFKDVVWSATSSHPAKPANQTYLEWPEKTALYGRNGRARFGYYQNSDIKDAGVLLQKTWEALQRTCDPKISIAGTCVDLYRLGYKDQPLRLHDTAIVEIEETGETFSKEIIMLDVDLVDPSGNRPEIGDYIPNIVYINRDTEDKATGGSGGGGGGGGGGRGKTNLEDDDSETWSAVEKTNNMIALVVGTRNGNNYVKAGEIGLAINKSGETGQYESTAYINADHVNISATSTNYSLAGELERTADGKLLIKSAGGMYVQRTESGITSSFGVWDNGNLTGGIMVQHINGQQGTITRLKGDIIIIGNDETISSTYRGKTLDGTLTQITTDFTSVNTLLAKKINTSELYAQIAGLAVVDMVQARTSGNIDCGGALSVGRSLAVNQSYGITNGGTGTFSAVSISGNSFTNCIVSASVSGNVLTLTPLTGSAITFSKAATLQAEYGGSNQGTQATYKVTGSPAGNFPSGATTTGTFTLHINTVAAWITDPSGTIRARLANPADTDAAYNNGWNDCLEACGISGGGTVYTGTWYGTLYVAPTGGATAVNNCVGKATGRQVDAK